MNTDTALKFERKPCGRCGGSGKYSYNQIDGDRCFGCAGVGQRLTKRAAIARDRMLAQRMIPARDLVPGMRVKVQGVGTFTVRQVGFGLDGSKWLDKNGVWQPYFTIKGETMGYSAFENTMVEVVPSEVERITQLRAAIEYQNSLPG